MSTQQDEINKLNITTCTCQPQHQTHWQVRRITLIILLQWHCQRVGYMRATGEQSVLGVDLLMERKWIWDFRKSQIVMVEWLRQSISTTARTSDEIPTKSCPKIISEPATQSARCSLMCGRSELWTEAYSSADLFYLMPFTHKLGKGFRIWNLVFLRALNVL